MKDAPDRLDANKAAVRSSLKMPLCVIYILKFDLLEKTNQRLKRQLKYIDVGFSS